MKKKLLLLSLFTILYSCGSDDDAQPQPEISPFDYTQEEKDAEIAWIENYIKDTHVFMYRSIQKQYRNSASGFPYTS